MNRPEKTVTEFARQLQFYGTVTVKLTFTKDNTDFDVEVIDYPKQFEREDSCND